MTDTHAHTDQQEQPKRRHRSPHGYGLYITDQELIELLGVPEDIARPTLRAFDKNTASGFPKKQKLWGDRRYWPAVKAYLDRLNGLKMEPSRREP